jgi:hypothetical protein
LGVHSEMPLDLNNAPEQRADGVIPDGTFSKVKMTVRPGGVTLPNMDPIDNGLFKASTTSEVQMLDCEFVVLFGPHSRRKFFQNFTIAGGQVDEKGVSKGWHITFGLLKAMLDSAIGLQPKDDSPSAQMKRRLRGIRDFDQIEFVAKIGVEAGGPAPGGGRYPDKNRLAHVVTPDEPEWHVVNGGGEAPAKPSGGGGSQPAASRAAPAQHEQKPAWQAQAAPAAAGLAGSIGGAPATLPGLPLSQPAPTVQPAAAPAAPSGPAWLNG